MKFRFPIIIIDEDFRSENTSGLGIRALAQAIEHEGLEVLGSDQLRRPVRSSRQQQSRAPVPSSCPSTMKSSRPAPTWTLPC